MRKRVAVRFHAEEDSTISDSEIFRALGEVPRSCVGPKKPNEICLFSDGPIPYVQRRSKKQLLSVLGHVGNRFREAAKPGVRYVVVDCEPIGDEKVERCMDYWFGKYGYAKRAYFFAAPSCFRVYEAVECIEGNLPKRMFVNK